MLCVRENALFWWKNLALPRSALPNHGKWWNHTLFFTENEADLRKIMKFWWNTYTFPRENFNRRENQSRREIYDSKKYEILGNRQITHFLYPKVCHFTDFWWFLWKKQPATRRLRKLDPELSCIPTFDLKRMKMKMFKHELEREQVQT